MDGAPHAQTNLQLLNGLRSAGHPARDVTLIRNAYEFALPLFSAQFRPSGKPFLAHLVGTASILARHGAGIDVVAAGLLHASYAQGDWGDGQGRSGTPERRAHLSALMGASVEDLVFRYTELRWKPDTIAAYRDRSGALVRPESDVVLMRLANLLEDYLDLGMAYCDKGTKTTHDDVVLTGAIALAVGLGHRLLADELEQAVKANYDADLPPVLRRRAHSSDTVTPRSLRLRSRLIALESARSAKKRLSQLRGPQPGSTQTDPSARP